MSYGHGVLRVAARAAIGVILVATPASAQDPPPSPAPPASAVNTPPADPRAEALAHFEKGNSLFKSGAVDAALAEFLESRRRYPSRSATSNAALCLTQLQRFDEALDLYESLLKDFPDLPEDLKAQAQHEVVRLRELVGTIDIVGAAVGAAITIDGRIRGEFPAPSPLRVAAGSHRLRVTKEGSEPFEDNVEVAGGQTARVVARLPGLARSGRLRLVEQSGMTVDVVVDGGVVGKTPYNGLLIPGDHAVWLRGGDDLGSGMEHVGTAPISVHVAQNQVSSMTLAARPLSASVRIMPVPMSAGVTIDSVPVGQGIWEGYLADGVYKIGAVASGFLPAEKTVEIKPHQVLFTVVELDRDPRSEPLPKPARPPRFVLEANGAVLITRTLGGAVATGCTDGCQLAVGLGGALFVHGGYELGSGFGFGITAGYLAATQASVGRATTVTAFGFGEDSVTANDTMVLRGAFGGVWTGFTVGSAPRVHLRLGAGALSGLISDTRTGRVEPRLGPAVNFGPARETYSTSLFYVTPELRVGLPVGRHAEISAGLAVPVFIDAVPPAWDETHPINAGGDGYGRFMGSEALSGKVFVIVAPGAGARYEF